MALPKAMARSPSADHQSHCKRRYRGQVTVSKLLEASVSHVIWLSLGRLGCLEGFLSLSALIMMLCKFQEYSTYD
jgi:hypothetical protein